MGFSDDLELQPLLFGFFLSMYMVAILGNLLISLTMRLDSHVDTPMYFLLSNLSMADICFISTTVPKMIMDIQTHGRAISYGDCLTQMSFLILFGCMDGMLLTAMAYDWFVAICHPLHYSVIMNPCLCCFFILVSLLDSQLYNLIVLQRTYFKDVKISNFYCYPSQFLRLVCFDTFTNNIVMYSVGFTSGFLPNSRIFVSYYKIVSERSVNRWKVQSLLHLWLSPVCLLILWNSKTKHVN
ncbi:Olfactory receptor 18 [Pteropus alecto]|uniref:Olfactory receptor 18 n=1 Tax=Pteropus alecto TaxID=9402 RepID=L5L4W6_PTEAL|nr:Olfactory receptor 18 [Pteropus alecto]